MKNRFFAISFALMIGCGLLHAQGLRFHGKVQNSIYALKSDQTHMFIYQYLQFSAAAAENQISLNGNLRAMSDARSDLASDQRFRTFALNVAFNQLFNNRLQVVAGRQFLHPGTALGALDGVLARLKVNERVGVQLYGGAESAPSRELKLIEPRDHLVIGGMADLRRFYATDVQLLYLQKMDRDGAYWQVAGLNLDNRSIRDTQVRLQAHFDLANSTLHRLLLNLRRSWNDRLTTELEFKAQAPQVYANSYFTIFELETFQQVRAAAAWQLNDTYALDGQYQLILTEGATANRLFFGLHDRHGSAGLIYETGDYGDQLGVSADYGYELVKNLTASVCIDYSRYRTETIYEYDQQLANAARLSYRAGRHWSAVVEYQWLTNRIEKQESRLLNHISFRW